MKKLIILVCVFAMGALFTGCGLFDKEITVTSIEAYGDKVEFDESFKLSDINVKVTKSDGNNEFISLSKEMITEEDLAKFQIPGQHTIKVTYLGVETTFEIKIVGEKGADGKEVELRVNENLIEWRYKGDTTWAKLIELSALTGPKGENGSEVELQVKDNYIQYKLKNATSWINLISLDLIRGETGPAGPVGPVGPQGPATIIEISEDGYWVINGFKTTTKAAVQTPEVQKYTILFDVNGGEMPKGYNAVLEDVLEGSLIDLPIPTRPNITFMGWFVGNELYDLPFSDFDTVQKDLELIAKWDYTIADVEKFINMIKPGNFSVNCTSLSKTPEGTFEQQVSALFNLDSDGNTIIYQEGSNIENSSKDIYEFIAYYLHTKAGNYNVYHDIEGWNFNFDEEEEYFDVVDLSLLQLSKFVRMNESNIYQYPINTELIHLTGFDFPDKVYLNINYGKSYAYLDINEMKLTVDLYINEDDYVFELYREFSFYDIGTTVVNFTVEQVRDSVNLSLDEHLEYEDFKFATDESKTAFLERLDAMKVEINNQNDFSILYNLYNEFHEELDGFEFVWDTLARNRAEYIEEMNIIFMDLSELATEESIVKMQLLLSAAIDKINTVTIMEGQWIVYYFEEELNVEFVLDEFKNELQNYRSGLYDQINSIIYEMETLVINTETIYRLSNEYESDFINAKTKEELYAIYQLVIENLKSPVIIYDYNRFNNFRTSKHMIYQTLFTDAINDLQYPYEIYDQYNLGCNAIYNSRNYFEVLDVFNENYTKLEEMILNYNKEFYLEKLEIIYNDKIKFVFDIDIERVVLLYESYMNQINSEENIKQPKELYTAFDNELILIQDDAVKVRIQKALYELESIYLLLLINSTDPSIEQMTGIYETAKGLISNRKTIEEIDTDVQNANNDLIAARVVDENKVALQDYKSVTRDNMLNFTMYINNYIYDYYILEDLYNVYYYVIGSCLSIEEVDAMYDLWYEDLLNLNVSINMEGYVNARNELILQLTNIIEFLSEHYKDSQADYIIELQNTLDIINSNYHLVKVLYAYGNFEIDPLEMVSNINIDMLSSTYDEYYELVQEDVKADLYDHYHNIYKVDFDNSMDYLEQYQVIVLFKVYVESLPLA